MYSRVKLESMVGKVLERVFLTEDKQRIVFTFQDGTERSFRVEGDCCSISWIEHLELPQQVSGSRILSVEESEGVAPWDGHICKPFVNYERPCGHDQLVIYNTKFQTDHGAIVLEYRNDSNGYYGGYLVEGD